MSEENKLCDYCGYSLPTHEENCTNNVEKLDNTPKIIVVEKILDNGESVDCWLPYNTVREREIFEEGILFGKKQMELK